MFFVFKKFMNDQFMVYNPNCSTFVSINTSLMYRLMPIFYYTSLYLFLTLFEKHKKKVVY